MTLKSAPTVKLIIIFFLHIHTIFVPGLLLACYKVMAWPAATAVTAIAIAMKKAPLSNHY